MFSQFGWAGKILRVDLTSRRITEEDTSKYAGRFLGGPGIAYKILWDEVPKEVQPFDPESRLIFCTGVLTGTPSPSSGRVEIVGKSPHTYPIPVHTRSGIGGGWGVELKQAGYDTIVVQGKASNPVYIRVKDREAEIIDADPLWGLDTYETQHEIKNTLGMQYKILTIGPAGENLVRYAIVLSDTGHAAGQGGFGAVMGSKNLKAIAVRGTRGVGVARPRELLELADYVKTLVTSLGATPKSVLWADKGVDPHDTKRIPYRYRSTAPGNPGAMDFIRKYWVKEVACSSCPVADFSFCNVPELGTGEVHCIQWYYCWLQGRADLVFWEAKVLHDKLGINNYDFMYMIPWLLKLREKGIISDESTGIPISAFPGRDFIVTLLNKVAYRLGFGDTLAEGAIRAAEKLGVKDTLLKEEARAGAGYGGHGMSAHYDPRDWVHTALLWVTDSRDPYCDKHTYIALAHWSYLSLEEQKTVAEYAYGSRDAIAPMGEPAYNSAEANAVLFDQDRSAVKNALGLCDWVFPLILSPLEERNYLGDTAAESKLLSTVTGVDITEAELTNIGKRIWNLHRALLVREGRRREDEDLPEYFFTEPTKWGSPPIDREKWEGLKDEYYRLRGWDVSTGVPTRAKLEELGLKDIADELERLGVL